MKKWYLPVLSTAFAVSVLAWAPSTAVAQTEPEDRGPYYEDDAWYDITEWFDGNDYNPTDEEAGEWDDETYSSWDARPAGDLDNDDDSNVARSTVAQANSNRSSQQTASNQRTGASDQGSDDSKEVWPSTSYYDYDRNQTYEVQMITYDTDGDGYVDAYRTWSDTNGDGLYDTAEYVAFSGANGDEQSKSSSVADSSDKKQIASDDKLEGQIQSVRQVATTNGQRLVATVKSEDNQTVQVDLGTSRRFVQAQGSNAAHPSADSQKSQNKEDEDSDKQSSKLPKQGDQLVANGTSIKANGKQVFIATSVKIDGQQYDIQRDTRNVEGKITKVKEFQANGKAHKMVMLDLKNQKSVAIDLGDAEKLKDKFDLEEGKSLKVAGVPVKIKDQRLIVATMIHQGDHYQTISRSKN